MKPRFLTKSLFKIGFECPRKLFYQKHSEYGNLNVDNSFLQALAEGGFQVGELAKVYYPGGTEIQTLDSSQAIQLTLEQLRQSEVILYEGAIQFENCLARVDILQKKGNTIDLIEVKAKSFDRSIENQFYNKTSLKKGKYEINSDWLPYLMDIAFQTYIATKAFPKAQIHSYLFMADKTKRATVNGLNQRFLISETSAGRTVVKVAAGTQKELLGEELLVRVCVDEEVKLILNQKFDKDRTFSELVQYLSDLLLKDAKAPVKVSSDCKGCEFRIPSKMKDEGKQSGFDECWKESAQLTEKDFSRPFVFDIWNFRKSFKLIQENVFFMDELHEEDIGVKEHEEPGLSSSQRQWLQVQKVQEQDNSPFVDLSGLQEEMNSWKYPLHFIDFETTMVAIPFHQGRRPYEQIAFQFSHHVVHPGGKIEHKTEYINRDKGKFPNFDFVRNLKQSLENDQGTVFRFAAHENTVLCQIYNQIMESGDSVPDRDELCTWIRTLTRSPDHSESSWEGKRCMVDMCELVKKYFYHPLTRGSNSIKKVLPAILEDSEFLQRKYSQPIYGTGEGIQSKNFKDHHWIRFDAMGKVIDPYKLLDPIFSDIDLETMDSLIRENSLADGGAAMTAYARMQFTEMSELESARVANALLRYCELDTFAMVLIYEYWMKMIEQKSIEVA